jgi:UDP-N-acetylmuramoyl-L-alanyl-D-glutamate--2,6-diaminopimelate ligase
VSILKDIIYKVAIEAIKGSTDIVIGKIDFDSRKIESNDVFVAIRGTVSDGHDYIEKAIELGATAIVCDVFPEVLLYGWRSEMEERPCETCSGEGIVEEVKTIEYKRI